VREKATDIESDLLQRFIDYWTEKNQKGVMRFEKEKFFDITKRLATFKQNSLKWNKTNFKPNKNSYKDTDEWQ
jgi:hypothetical protein